MKSTNHLPAWSVIVGAMLFLAAGAPAAEATKLDFMPLFPEEELAKPHVFSESIYVGHDFVDGQWQGIIAASDGRTYFSFSSHGPETNAQFYCYDPRVGKVEHLADVGVWCGYADSPGKYNVQGKIHSNIYEYEGKLYCSTTSAHTTLEHPYPGGHFLAYDLETGALENLAKVDYDGKGGLLTMVLDPVYERLYAIHQYRNTLVYYDLNTRRTVEIGSIQDGMQCRNLIVDPHGIVYGTAWGGTVYRYNPETETMGCLLTRIPFDPEAPQPSPDPALRAWEKTTWTPIVWDPVTEWWYAVRGNDEYLFRFRPPADPRSHRGQVAGLAQFGYRPSKEAQPRWASLGMALKDRTIYYCSYPLWRSMAHLMSYNIDSGTVVNHGPIVTSDGRRVSEIQAMAVGSDGKLHCAAMVWSIEGRDPAKPWANRAQCYFHSRFLIIDPQGLRDHR